MFKFAGLVPSTCNFETLITITSQLLFGLVREYNVEKCFDSHYITTANINFPMR